MALLTVLAIAGKPLIPPKNLVLYPSTNVHNALYGPPQTHNEPGARWLDQSVNHLRCEMPLASNPMPCGIVFIWNEVRESECVHRVQFDRCSSAAVDPDGDGWGTENGKNCVVVTDETSRAVIGNPLCASTTSDPDGDGWGWENEESCIVVSGMSEDTSAPICTTADSDPDGDGWGWENELSCRAIAADTAAACTDIELIGSIDATGYDGLIVKVHYEGRSPYLRLNVMGTNPELLALGKKPKPMSTYLSTEDLRTGATFVGLKELSVEQWWTVEQNPPRHLAAPGFSHVTQVGFDTYDRGVHRLRVDEIRLTGERISTETYLLTIALLWACYLLLEAGVRYYRLRTTCQREQQLLEWLVGDAQQLEEEKVLLEHRAQTDPLTQAYNRNGLAQRLQQQYETLQLPSGTGLLIFDIDHFKALNDTYGHDAGDDVLRDLSKLMISAVRAEDIFARWGGEEFVLIVDRLAQDKLMAVAEKLRQIVAHHHFLKEKRLKVTVSIGVARSLPGEHFDALFKRADKALYQAKSTRNTVTYAR